jgi:hypothetical protein
MVAMAFTEKIAIVASFPDRCRPRTIARAFIIGGIVKYGLPAADSPSPEHTMNKLPENTNPPAPPTDAHVEEALDEALEESFPASDPVAIGAGTSAHDELEQADKT